MAIIKIWGNDKIHKIMLYFPSYNGVKNVIVVTQTNAFWRGQLFPLPPPGKIGPHFMTCPPPLWCALPSPINIITITRHHKQFLLPPVSPGKPPQQVCP